MEESAAEVRGRNEELCQAAALVGATTKDERGCLLRAKSGSLENTVQRLRQQQFELEIKRQSMKAEIHRLSECMMQQMDVARRMQRQSADEISRLSGLVNQLQQ